MPPQRVPALYKVIDLFFIDHVVFVLIQPSKVAKNKRGKDLKFAALPSSLETLSRAFTKAQETISDRCR
ncbi:MAG TPA: hypothetical protein DCY35_03020 [Prolixibacteraceae bacterium]|nr:hypothetical protein [Prolixibacteraceae bacterium]